LNATGRKIAVSTDGLRPVVPSVSTPFIPRKQCCVDPNCGCVACLMACDRDAAAGRIPTNFAWWMSQTFYPVETTPVEERVPIALVERRRA
jgi:hypothetical protein